MERHGISKGELSKIFKNFSRSNVVVVGDLIIDEYTFCEPLGMSQEDPTIVVRPVEIKRYVGGAGIVAKHAASLGARVQFISVTGNDELGRFAEHDLGVGSVRANFIADDMRPTTLKRRYRCQGQTLFRLSELTQDDVDTRIEEEIFELVKKCATNADIIVLSDFNYGCLPDSLVRKIITWAKSRKIFIAADSQSSSQLGDVSRFVGVDLITPTEYEARLALKDQDNGLVVLAERLKKKANSANVLLKLGKEGVLIQGTDQRCDYITDKLPSLNPNPKDVAGAGDSMLITAAIALSQGEDIWRAALIGTIAAAIQISKIGNVPLRLEEIDSVTLR